MSNVDSHQVLRGVCESDGCKCTEFVKGDTPKCAVCKHAPVKHKDLSNKGSAPAPAVQQETAATPQANPPFVQPVPAASTPQDQPSYQNPTIYSPQPNYMQPQHLVSFPTPPNPGYPPNVHQQMLLDQQQQQQQHMQYMQMQAQLAGQIPCKQCNCFYPEHTGACAMCFPRGNCKICTVNIVFMDLSMSEGLRTFDYCSPECRNKDLPRLDKEAGISQESS